MQIILSVFTIKKIGKTLKNTTILLLFLNNYALKFVYIIFLSKKNKNIIINYNVFVLNKTN